MTDRLNNLLKDAKLHQKQLEEKARELNSFAHKLASQSMASHIDEITQKITLFESKPVIELVEFRLKAESLIDGSIPLNFVANIANEIRQMIGHAAFQIQQGTKVIKRVPESLYEKLDLRLAAVLQGSSRLVITAASERDLFDESLSKSVLEKIFDVLESRGEGEEFLEAISSLGSSSSRHLRYFLEIIKGNSAQLELFWRYSGETVREWNGNDKVISDVVLALNKTESISSEEVVVKGVIELLSKREKIYLLTDNNQRIRILFPKRLLEQVSTLHLDQYVTLRCSVTETENPLTRESAIFYELVQVIS